MYLQKKYKWQFPATGYINDDHFFQSIVDVHHMRY